MPNIYDDEAFFRAYAEMPRSQHGLAAAGEWPQMMALMPELAGREVLDLGCGYGWHSRYAMAHGAASVTAIDQSERMIARARRINAAPGIDYRVCSLEEYEYPPERFDLVISNLVLHYAADLDSVYRSVFGALRPGGVFLMNIEHPVFTAAPGQQWFQQDGHNLHWPVDNYFYPGERETDFLGHAVVKQHHTLTQILMGLIRAGFRLEAVEEVIPPLPWRESMPDEMRRPMMLLVRAAKSSMTE